MSDTKAETKNDIARSMVEELARGEDEFYSAEEVVHVLDLFANGGGSRLDRPSDPLLASLELIEQDLDLLSDAATCNTINTDNLGFAILRQSYRMGVVGGMAHRRVKRYEATIADLRQQLAAAKVEIETMLVQHGAMERTVVNCRDERDVVVAELAKRRRRHTPKKSTKRVTNGGAS